MRPVQRTDAKRQNCFSRWHRDQQTAVQAALRYSEDIDLVQTQAESIGTTVNAIREALSWLGKCNREQARHSMHLVFKFTPEADPQATLKLKVDQYTRA